MDYKLGRIYARTNAALVNKSVVLQNVQLSDFVPVLNHAQIQLISGRIFQLRSIKEKLAWERG